MDEALEREGQGGLSELDGVAVDRTSARAIFTSELCSDPRVLLLERARASALGEMSTPRISVRMMGRDDCPVNGSEL